MLCYPRILRIFYYNIKRPAYFAKITSLIPVYAKKVFNSGNPITLLIRTYLSLKPNNMSKVAM